MPIYPFRCIACDYTMEDFYGLHEPKPEVCPKCGQSTLKQEVGLASNWHPHPIVFRRTAARNQAVAEAANVMVKNNDDRK